MEAARAPSRTAWHRDAPVIPACAAATINADDEGDGDEADGVFDGDVSALVAVHRVFSAS